MDKINEYRISGKPGKYCFNVPQNSTILSARRIAYSQDIMIGVLVDIDNFDNLEEKCVLVFNTESEIADNMKAKFLGVVVTGTYTNSRDVQENVVYVFEKLR